MFDILNQLEDLSNSENITLEEKRDIINAMIVVDGLKEKLFNKY